MSAISKLTARDQELLPLAWLCLQGEVKIDFQKLAREGGFTNVGSASNAWARIAKKLAIPRGGSKSDKRAKYEAMSTNTSPKRKRGEEGEEVKKEKFKVRKEEMVVVEEMKLRKEEDVVVEEMKVKEEEEEGPVKKRARVRPRIKKEAIDGSREEEEDTYRLSSIW